MVNTLIIETYLLLSYFAREAVYGSYQLTETTNGKLKGERKRELHMALIDVERNF